MESKHSPHILVADDDHRVLKLFSRLLEEAGYRVTAVDSSDAVTQVLDDQRIDLLVLDLKMPRPDGFDVLKKLRVQRPGLTILAISGYLEGALLKPAEILGATASLAKSEAPDHLVEKVRYLLR